MFTSKGTWLKSSGWRGKKAPGRASCAGISVMVTVNSLCVVKSRPTGFCFVEVSSKDAWEHLLCLHYYNLQHSALSCWQIG